MANHSIQPNLPSSQPSWVSNDLKGTSILSSEMLEKIPHMVVVKSSPTNTSKLVGIQIFSTDTPMYMLAPLIHGLRTHEFDPVWVRRTSLYLRMQPEGTSGHLWRSYNGCYLWIQYLLLIHRDSFYVFDSFNMYFRGQRSVLFFVILHFCRKCYLRFLYIFCYN